MPRFPIMLRTTFGDYYPPPALREIEGTPMRWTESIADRGESRLISFFRSKPRVVAFLRAVLGAAIQDAHDAAYQLLTERWLDTSIGAQLDRIGWLVNLPRAGWPDETYRQLLRAQVLVLRSNGRWGDLVSILLVLGATPTGIRFADSGPAGGRIVTVDDFDAGTIGGYAIASLLRRAKAAGVRLTFDHPGGAVTESFTLADYDEPQRDLALGLGGVDDDPDAGGVLAAAHGSTLTETG